MSRYGSSNQDVDKISNISEESIRSYNNKTEQAAASGISNLSLESNMSARSLKTDDSDDSTTIPQGPPIKVLLLGKTGNGKSATGNMILDNSEDVIVDECFESRGQSVSLTTTVKKVQQKVRGRDITVVDTPGTCDTSRKPDEILKEIASAVVKSTDGYDAFIIIIKYGGRMTPEERTAIDQLKQLFGDKIFEYSIVVITQGSTFDVDQMRRAKRDKQPMFTIEEFVKQDEESSNPGALGPIVREFKGGVVLFENLEKDYVKRRAMVAQLVAKIDNVMKRNGGKRFTNFMFQEAEKEIQKEIRNPNSCNKSESGEVQMKKEVEDKVVEKVTQKAKQERSCIVL